MNILVTGVSRGVGLEICSVLLNHGYTVYGIARTYTRELKELEEKFKERFFFKNIDLINSENIPKLVFKDFITNKIPLEGFVNNAAVAYDDLLTNLNIDRLKKMYEINVFSPLVITKYVIRNMIFNNIAGSIVHISSISVHTGYKGLTMYASSKGALEAFSKNTAREWGGLGIRSNVVVPGFMETTMSSTLTDNQKEKIYNRTSLKSATDINSVAETVAFLLSEKAKSITGQNIHVDNGTI